MLGEIYIASALAIFLAIFGWSEKIFGYSNKHMRMILSFCEKTELTYPKYVNLMDLIKQEKKMDPGRYMKQIIKILKGSKIKIGDKDIINKLINNSKLLKELLVLNKRKKIYFILLFIYLFIGGTSLIYFETYFSCLFTPPLLSQIILLTAIIIGTKIYFDIDKKEKDINNNLMIITTKIEAGK